MSKFKNMHEQAVIGLLSHISKQLTIVESKQDFILNLISQKFDFDLDKMYSDIEKINIENNINNVSSIEDIFDKIEDIKGYDREIKFPWKDDDNDSNS